MILAHSTWRASSKTALRIRLVRIDRSGRPDGDRAVWVDWRLRVGFRNGSAIIGSLGAAGGGRRAAGSGKWWLIPIVLVLQGHGVFVSEYQNNPNRLHTNKNCNIVKDGINNTYDTIVLWLHTNMNSTSVQGSMNNTYNKILL